MPFYLNIIIENKEEVLHKQVDSALGGLDTGLFKGLGGNIANKLVSDDDFADGIADILAVYLPEMLVESGITLRLEKRYAIGSLVVLLVIVDDADVKKMAKLAEAEGHSWSANCMDGCADLARKIGCNRALSASAASIVESSLQTRIQQILATGYFQERGVKAKTQILQEKDQASFFFNALAKMKVQGSGRLLREASDTTHKQRVCCFDSCF
mmetsp:Transcript_142869/g.249188  ORF Transcript_142869/g.249188 Transcript_142869/m.249188 type:complete len:212 (-) Transcript_142869:622-1257(-)